MNDPFLLVIQKYIPEPKLILDIGAMDCAQSVFFRESLPGTRVVAFEPLPAHLEQCRKTGTELVEAAAFDYTGETDFYAIKPGTNSGASSIYEPLGNILPWDVPPEYEKITVPCTRIDDWMLANAPDKKIDAVWMDVQGAELQVLEGFGDFLDYVGVIATECETEPVYHGNPTQFQQLNEFMFDAGFVLVKYVQAWEKEADLIYVNRNLL